jgi:hypothetical protein
MGSPPESQDIEEMERAEREALKALIELNAIRGSGQSADRVRITLRAQDIPQQP